MAPTARFALTGDDPVLRRPRRAARAALLGALAGLVLAAAGVLLTAPVSRATTVVTLSETSPVVDLTTGGTFGRRVSVDTDAAILRSDAVVAAVARATGDDARTVARATTVTARQVTRVLEITYAAADPATARAGSAASAQALLDVRRRLVLDPVAAYLDRVVAASAEPVTLPDAATDPTGRPVRNRAGAGLETRRQAAVVMGAELPDAGRVLEATRLVVTDDRGDVVLRLASGTATGALAAVLLTLVPVRRGTRRTGRRRPRVARVPRPTTRRDRARRGARWAVAGALAGAAAGWLAAPVVTPSAGARADVLLAPLPGTAFTSTRGDTVVDLRTEAQVPLSQEVLSAVVAQGVSDLPVEALRRRVSTGLVDGTQVIAVKARARSGAQAVALAAAVAEQTLARRAELARAAASRHAAALDARIAAAQEQFAAEAARPQASVDRVRVLSQRVVALRRAQRAVTVDLPSAGAVLSCVPAGASPLARLPVAVLAGGPLAGALAGALLGHRHTPRRRVRSRAVPAPRAPGGDAAPVPLAVR